MREPQAITDARCVLGAQLAACRRAAGLSQVQLAQKVGFISRSAIANAETGRQGVSRDFWERIDPAVSAGGSLLAAFDKLDKAARHAAAQAIQQSMNSTPATWPTASPPAQPLPELPAAPLAADPATTGVDMLAAVAAQARDHAARAATTGIGPGTVEQLTAEVVRVSRCYVAGSPLPLFGAMHQVFGRVQTALNQKSYPGQARHLHFLAGALCGLMANASLDLGREDAADDLARAAWTYGTIIDHGPLAGWPAVPRPWPRYGTTATGTPSSTPRTA